MRIRSKLVISFIIFLLIIIIIYILLLIRPKNDQSDINKPPTQIYSPTPSIINQIKINKIELFQSQTMKDKKSKIPFISRVFVTQDESNITNHLNINQLIEDKETYLVINSTSENPRILDIYLLNSDISQTNIHFNITIKKGIGYFSIGTNLKKGNYKILIVDVESSFSLLFNIV